MIVINYYVFMAMVVCLAASPIAMIHLTSIALKQGIWWCHAFYKQEGIAYTKNGRKVFPMVAKRIMEYEKMVRSSPHIRAEIKK